MINADSDKLHVKANSSFSRFFWVRYSPEDVNCAVFRNVGIQSPHYTVPQPTKPGLLPSLS